MSNYKTKAKRPNGEVYEEVEMIDDFFGSHQYGVLFPDGAYYRESGCKILSDEELSSGNYV